MRTLLFLILIIVLAIIGFAVLDYFGFYVSMKHKFISIAVLAPVIKGIQTFISNPFKKLKDAGISKKVEKNGIDSKLNLIEQRLTDIEKKINTK